MKLAGQVHCMSGEQQREYSPCNTIITVTCNDEWQSTHPLPLFPSSITFCIFNGVLMLGDRQKVVRHTTSIKTTFSRLKLIDDTAHRQALISPCRLALLSLSVSVSRCLVYLTPSAETYCSFVSFPSRHRPPLSLFSFESRSFSSH